MDLESQMTMETMESLNLMNRRNESFSTYESVVAQKTKKVYSGVAVETGYVKAKGKPVYRDFSEMEKVGIKEVLRGLTNRNEILDVMHKFAHNKVKTESAFLSQGNLTAALHAREDQIDETHYKIRRNPEGNWAYMRSGKEQSYGNYFG